MDRAQFASLSQDLRRVAKDIPLRWGHIQNNNYDNQLRQVCNIFAVMSLDELEGYIARFDDDHKNYYRRRWYMVRCADCDEYLFYCNPGVEHNPDRKDKEWDIRINQLYKFDVKGTVIPKDYRDDWESVINDPNEIVEFYYDKQSKGVRYDMQNRLFIVHHSLVDLSREFLLRCAWGTKAYVYKKFVDRISDVHFMTYKGCTASVIFLLETERNQVCYKISGLDSELQTIPRI